MSDNKGQGSVLLKIAIAVLVVVLVVVITIPGKIWKEEAREMITAHGNMISLYEAEMYYHGLVGSFTTDPAELLKVIRQDSVLQRRQELVNHTKTLAGLIDDYLDVPFIKSAGQISENLGRIREDLESNKRNFRLYEDIKNEAENIDLSLATLLSSERHPNYVKVSGYIDSLKYLRRDMSDFSLQNCAAKAKSITDTLQKLTGNIDIQGLEMEWILLHTRIEAFAKTVNRSELVNVTSVADRIRDFKDTANKGFETIRSLDRTQNTAQAEDLKQRIGDQYQAYLSDYLITSNKALYRLSDADSMVLHLTEENFYCPVSSGMYKIFITDDSAFVKIESPILVSELNGKLLPVSEEIKNLNAVGAFDAYVDTLSMIKDKAYTIRKTLRKNTDIFIQYKELEEIINRFNEISIISAYNELSTLVDKTPDNYSYDDMKTLSESGLNGIRIFKQAYTESFFGNLDSLHKDLVVSMQNFNELLSSVRRLPKSIVNFEKDIQMIDQLKEAAKNTKDAGLEDIEKELGDIYLFASEGTTQRVYGVFSKKITNFGYIFKNTKSWEED